MRALAKIYGGTVSNWLTAVEKSPKLYNDEISDGTERLSILVDDSPISENSFESIRRHSMLDKDPR